MVLKVPAEAIGDYKTATNWNTGRFKAIEAIVTIKLYPRFLILGLIRGGGILAKISQNVPRPRDR